MRPYYSDDLVSLYHGDCREVAAWLEADVLVTDPPYGIPNGRLTRSNNQRSVWDSIDLRDAAISLWGDVRPGLVFGTWKSRRPEGVRQVLIWDKSDGNGHGSGRWSPWGVSHEEISVLGEWPPLAPGGRVREGGVPARESGVLRVANYNSQASDRPDHPTPKPVALMGRLIAKCPPGVIADPFTGSGSTLIAAAMLGRRAVGVEIDESYCDLAAKRLCQGTFFGGAA